ncbi:hypothetical protein SAMN05216344_11234 [Polaromonas sp. OV174]|nr:hypothetical protein SAMN05216344_11234 [Polaromonas sp. OV174]
MSKLVRAALVVLLLMVAGCSSMGSGTGSPNGASGWAQDMFYTGGRL